MIEELHDVYLSYMYDTDLKRKVIIDLVSEVFNHGSDESMLDGQSMAEYITERGRNHEKSNE